MREIQDTLGDLYRADIPCFGFRNKLVESVRFSSLGPNMFPAHTHSDCQPCSVQSIRLDSLCRRDDHSQ